MYVRQCCLTLPHKAGNTENNSQLVSADEAAPASGLAVEMDTREPFTGWARAGDRCQPHSYSLMQPEEYPESTGRTGTHSLSGLVLLLLSVCMADMLAASHRLLKFKFTEMK